MVSEPGRSESGGVFIFCLVSEPGRRRSGPGALFFFLLGILSQIRGATADGEKRVVMGMGWGHFGPFGATEVQVPIPH